MFGTQRPLLLYVEDQAVIQYLVESSLSEAGYDVWTASDGTQALEKLASVRSTLSGLVTDIDLGDCPNGWQVAREARMFVPELPVVYVSGGSAHDWRMMGVPDSLIVTKPFFPDQIVAAMASLFAKAAR